MIDFPRDEILNVSLENIVRTLYLNDIENYVIRFLYEKRHNYTDAELIDVIKVKTKLLRQHFENLGYEIKDRRKKHAKKNM